MTQWPIVSQTDGDSPMTHCDPIVWTHWPMANWRWPRPSGNWLLWPNWWAQPRRWPARPSWWLAQLAIDWRTDPSYCWPSWASSDPMTDYWRTQLLTQLSQYCVTDWPIDPDEDEVDWRTDWPRPVTLDGPGRANDPVLNWPSIVIDGQPNDNPDRRTGGRTNPVDNPLDGGNDPVDWEVTVTQASIIDEPALLIGPVDDPVGQLVDDWPSC